MHAFSRLLKTDLRNRRNTLLIAIGMLVLLNAALALLPFLEIFNGMRLDFVMTLNIAVFCSALLIPLTHCFSTWREEWKQRSIYLLLSLPVPRTHLLLSKCVTVILEALILTGVMAAGLSLQNGLHDGLLFRAEPLVTMTWAKAWFILRLLLAGLCLVSLCFFSSLLGKCFRRSALFVTFLVFVAGLLVTIVAMANLPPSLVFVIFGLGYFIGSTYLLEKKAGVE
ncbi:ABC-2 transporter permease [Paenibacillus mesophilus]|uniref:ABC-2 transporter permease n=1 Tax=Paenibacillus mesophilus TaxID=2582849 RepID=UPI001305271B|nr:ABC-2 transporter permease [Paenibacillus mesophilus]